MDPTVTASKLHGQVASYLADFAGKAGAPRGVLNAEHRDDDILNEGVDKLWSGQAHVHDLGKAYKYAPHGPPALLYKYIVHRVKNLDGYDSKDTAHNLDHDFFREHDAGTGDHHSRVTTHHLNEWLNLNPHLVAEALVHKDNLQSMVTRGIGLNLKMINSEPHVAMTRGLNTAHVGPEHALSSFADLPDTGFGRHQHRMWMPVKDLWYAFPTSPMSARGIHGHENEWLFTHSGERYRAEPSDVRGSWASLLEPMGWPSEVTPDNVPDLPYDDISADALDANALHMPFDQLKTLHALGQLGPEAYKAYRVRGGSAAAVADSPYMKGNEARELAMHQMESGAMSNLALHNPNLTPGDLVNIVKHPDFIPEKDLEQLKFASYLRSITKNPSFNSDVASKLMERISDGDLHKHAVHLAHYTPVPIPGLHRYLLGALGAGDTVEWSPEFAIADAFNDTDEDNPTRTPTAFNNTQNTDRYLRALEHYYTQNPDDADSARNVYHKMLTGARMDEGLTASLVETHQAFKTLPGIDMEDASDLLEDVARFNEHLTERSMIHFAQIPEGRQGLLKRDWLPENVQLELADKIDDQNDVAMLIDRADLFPTTADSILRRAQGDETGPADQMAEDDDLRWIGRHVANNPAVPNEILERHMTLGAKKLASVAMDEDTAEPYLLGTMTPLERGLLDGLWARKSNPTSHIVHPLPPGAAS